MTLKEKIDAMVERRVSEMLDAMMGDGADTIDVPANLSTGQKVTASGAVIDRADATRQTRKRGRGRNKVAYVRATHKGRNRDPKDVAKDLPAGNVRLAWTAIVSAKAPISAYELEAKTGMGRKAVESAVWALRNAGLVKSQPVSE